MNVPLREFILIHPANNGGGGVTQNSVTQKIDAKGNIATKKVSDVLISGI